MMTIQVLEADYRGDHRVWLRFADGLAGEADLSDELEGEVFEPLRDPSYFARFVVDETLLWPNGAGWSKRNTLPNDVWPPGPQKRTGGRSSLYPEQARAS